MKKIILSLVAIWGAANGFASFKIVAIPDSQKLSQYNPAPFLSQTQWIVNNIVAEDIEFVTHLGDVVNNNVPGQWSAATTAMDLLDGAVPYSVSIGNHDYDTYRTRDEGTDEFTDRFGPAHYAGYSWYKGANRRGLNHCQIFSAGGREWLHLNLEFMPDDESLLWAQRILDAHPDLPAIVSTHAYLNQSGALGPNDSASSGMGAVSNGGGNQWAKFVSHNDQIFMVLNGHYFNEQDGVDLLVSTNDFGREVFQMCVDYQWEWSNGYLRTFEFDLVNDTIYAETFAPHTGAILTGPDDQFTLNIDFDTRFSNFSRREELATIQAGNLVVVQHNLNNSNNSVTVSIPTGQSTAAFSVVALGTASYAEHSNGDYFIQAGSRIEDDLLNGIMIASVAENGRSGTFHVASAPAGSRGQYWIAVAKTGSSGNENDVNVGVAYFPFHQGWTCGRLTVVNENGASWSFMGSENIMLGDTLTQLPQGIEISDPNLLLRPGGSWASSEGSRGIWNLEIPGVDSIEDGVLLVCSGENEDNYASATPWPDGSGWAISLKDSGSNGTGTEGGPLNFVYVPYSTGNMVAGRVGGSGSVFSGTSGFSLASTGTGTVRLDIDGYAPADGTLIVSSENDGASVDDFNTYEPEGDHWMIQTRDLPNSGLSNPSSGQFVFAFFPFDNPPVRPGGLIGVTAWAAGYGLGGTNTIAVADPDSDGFNNLHEYALGGDPTNSSEWGHYPSFALGAAGGTNWMDYTHPERVGEDIGISYWLESNTNLLSGDWANADYEVVGTGVIDPNYNAVTNRISTDEEDGLFIRLIVEEK